MRRVLTLLLTVAMMLSLIVVASADTAVKLCIEPEGDASGNTVVFNVSLDPQGTKKVGAFQFSVTATNGTIIKGERNTALEYDDEAGTGYFANYGGEVVDGQYNFVAAGTTDTRVWTATEKTLIAKVTVQLNDGAKNCKLNVITTGDKRFSVGAKDSNGTVSEAYTSAVDSKNYGESDVLLGDVNGDNVIDYVDAAMVYAYFNGTLTFTDAQSEAADVNGDNVIDYVDAAMVYAYFNGTLTKFPAA